MIRWVRSVWTRLRGGVPCYVCGRQALSPQYQGWYVGREKFIHAEHLVMPPYTSQPPGRSES